MARFDQKLQRVGLQNNAETINQTFVTSRSGWWPILIGLILALAFLALVVGPPRLIGTLAMATNAIGMTTGSIGMTTGCKAFPNQAAAQARLRTDPTDPLGLDRERDGLACEGNSAPRDMTPVPRQ
jgi:hypothetical protein